MIKYLTLLSLLLSMSASATSVSVSQIYTDRQTYGSGTPSTNTSGYEESHIMPDSLLHTPGAMPGYPTAAPIWPHVVKVDCVKVDTTLLCNGYDVNATTGRGEYLFTRPGTIVEASPEKTVPSRSEPRLMDVRR